MSKPNQKKRRSVSGQAMLEYVIALAATLGVVVALAYLMVAVKQNGSRVLDLVASEYP
ncbi:MAG: hypothetical protein FWG05_02575 [Kiritimatiellaeota bacterium]|nr:hypothetical protein [Kiritimatiellota bacterium]